MATPKFPAFAPDISGEGCKTAKEAAEVSSAGFLFMGLRSEVPGAQLPPQMITFFLQLNLLRILRQRLFLVGVLHSRDFLSPCAVVASIKSSL